MWSQDDSDDEVLVMVVRTGWNTSAGSMLREVVASSRPPVAKSLVQVTLHDSPQQMNEANGRRFHPNFLACKQHTDLS